eukprot:TRINITY_DN3873_c0_g1_i2.p1 TRINITY_DN3873_c0_g1~~TRINITY_DN3873_c0_g1_i2.p1  ORF type:complete len:348 (+),score=68.77 TRINITY_DN3873_c0_g1_i2:106-1149(+)
MLSRVNGVVWMEEEGDEEDTVSWTRNHTNNNSNMVDNNKEDMASLSTFKSMLEDDWYVNTNTNTNPSHHDFQTIQNHHHHHHHHQEIKDIGFSTNHTATDNILLQPVDSSSSCSPSSVFNLDPSQVQPFLPNKSCLSSLLNVVCTNPFENSFDLDCDTGFLTAPSSSSVLMNRGSGVLTGFNQMGTPDLSPNHQFTTTRLLPLSEPGFDPTGFGGFESPSPNLLFSNRSKVLRPLEIFPPVGAQPTLFQKRAALRQNSSTAACGGGGGQVPVGVRIEGIKGKRELEEENEKRRKIFEEDEMDEASIDGSGLNYDTDEATENNKAEENAKNGGSNSNANSTVTGGDQK